MTISVAEFKDGVHTQYERNQFIPTKDVIQWMDFNMITLNVAVIENNQLCLYSSAINSLWHFLCFVATAIP